MVTSSEKCAAGAARDAGQPILRKPDATDGRRVWDLVAACPPLDRNSMYCNLLQCTDFSDTCIVAERNDDLVGWISGYRPPGEKDTLFIWQVAVHEDARGLGLAGKMLTALINREDCAEVDYIKTTVTRDNDASRALFRSVAERSNAAMQETTGFERDAHFDGEHDSERLITIGPIPPGKSARRSAPSVA